MAWAVKFSWHAPVGSFQRKVDAQELARQMRDSNEQAGLEGPVKVVKVGASNPSRSTRKRVGRALTKYVRNFTGTITRTQDGQVVIAGRGPKPKTAKNPAHKEYPRQWVRMASGTKAAMETLQRELRTRGLPIKVEKAASGKYVLYQYIENRLAH